MAKAAADLLAVASHCYQPEDAKRYRRIQKAMVRICKDWNKIEHIREKRDADLV